MEVQVQMGSTLLIFIISAAALVNGIKIEPSSSHLVPCKKGWYLFGERCYKVLGIKDPRSWTEAVKTCDSLGGQLAAIESKEEQDFLTTFLLLNERVDAWIGLQKQWNQWKWINGIPVNYTNWVPTEGRGDCVRMIFSDESQTGMWKSDPCNNKLPFICQMDENKQEEYPDLRFCSLKKGGGFKFMNSCYHVITKEESWEDAEEYCQSRFSGHLVTILNFETGRFLQYVTSDILQSTWIGVKVRDRDLQIWSSGWHVIFNRWIDEQDLIKGYCGLKTRNNYWITDNCEKKYPFICETSDSKPPIYKKGAEGWRCPSKEWKDLDGDTCYIFETTKSLKWYEANYYCMTKGGSLAVINSEVESIIIHPHVLSYQNTLLIGLHRKLDDKGKFEWIDGSEIDYQNWNTGEPNNIKEECGEIWAYSMKWNDVSCDAQKGYICSAKKLPPIFYEENTPTTNFSRAECQKSDDAATANAATANAATTNAFIIVISILITVIFIGTVTFLFKFCCQKNKFSFPRELSLLRF